jgi:hypothetical protein
MASWIEIERVRKNPKTFKPLAAHLLKMPDGDWWEYAERFLRDVSAYQHPELNTRQAEYLLKLRDDKAKHFKVGDGFNVAILIGKCFQARFDLDVIATLNSSSRCTLPAEHSSLAASEVGSCASANSLEKSRATLMHDDHFSTFRSAIERAA